MSATIHRLLFLVATLAVLATGCASIDWGGDGSVAVEITGLPEQCHEDLVVKVTIEQDAMDDDCKPIADKPKVRVHDTVRVTNGTVNCRPRPNSVADQEAGRTIKKDCPITVKIKIMSIDPACEAFLKASLPGNPNVSPGSTGTSPSLKPDSPGHWTTDIRTFKF
ncbi:MAG: hypothetical protein IT453_01955 [Planctomycetes bacterium]|nr:hypothetical protein [Planctomycetota bacterium]